MRLIDVDVFVAELKERHENIMQDSEVSKRMKWCEAVHYGSTTAIIEKMPTIEATPVVHGRWERCGGDLHSSGYAVYCSACYKTHFVHYKSSLGGLFGCKELFEKPKYCPSCGAFMECRE